MAKAKNWHDEEDQEEIIYVSKTELKRDMDELKKLGEELVNMPEKKRAKIALDDETVEAILLGIKIRNKREAYRRHLQFIGRLLRSKDVDAIKRDLLKIKESHLLGNLHSQKLEEMRDNLINNGDDTIEQLLADYPQLDRSRLRQLIRQANKEKQAEKPVKAMNQLFQYLKESIPFE